YAARRFVAVVVVFVLVPALRAGLVCEG
ncbi:hypothetical protein A2U01_0108452, partial [Trifolium medium]|nr:hypothetical protein [Trifolium medium]